MPFSSLGLLNINLWSNLCGPSAMTTGLYASKSPPSKFQEIALSASSAGKCKTVKPPVDIPHFIFKYSAKEIISNLNCDPLNPSNLMYRIRLYSFRMNRPRVILMEMKNSNKNPDLRK
ncbi:hypothetical protein WA026_005702 [Henosepilachna vigintioctopunctata]|uniref:Uncharacterized protein n=1 Tax=Henosepilachna vigintioctopunctata TaxID=420089 RepID=A0AAW1U1X0_9CUCU